jgi:hypothetical protein
MRRINRNCLSQEGFCVCSAGEVLADFLRTETRKESNLAGRWALPGRRDMACGTRKIGRIPAQCGESTDVKKSPTEKGWALKVVVGRQPAPNLYNSAPWSRCKLLRKGAEPSPCRLQSYQFPPASASAKCPISAASSIPLSGIECAPVIGCAYQDAPPWCKVVKTGWTP